jgi:hypothetical protein
VPQRGADKGREVAGVSTGNESAVFDDFPIEELGPGVFNVLNHGLVAGESAAADHVGGDQQLGRVSDGKDWLAAANEITGEPHGILIHPQFVGGISPWTQESVEIFNFNRVDGFIDGHGRVVFFTMNGFSGLQPNMNQSVSGFAKCLCRFGVLRILKHIGDDYGNSTHEILLAFSISGLLFLPAKYCCKLKNPVFATRLFFLLAEVRW